MDEKIVGSCFQNQVTSPFGLNSSTWMPLPPLPPPWPCQFEQKMLPLGRISNSEKKFGRTAAALTIFFVPKRNPTMCVVWSTTSHDEPKAVQISVSPSFHAPPPTGGPSNRGSQMWPHSAPWAVHSTLPEAS